MVGRAIFDGCHFSQFDSEFPVIESELSNYSRGWLVDVGNFVAGAGTFRNVAFGENDKQSRRSLSYRSLLISTEK